jgi:mannose-1-phosphate guanylyltransferase/phosphomannomutase
VKAVIMAGGEGTRLRPLTSNQPKPMVPLVNRPMMEHIVRLLQRHGFDDIVVTVSFMAENIRTYFGDGSEFGVRMAYATEETPLGTAGSVRNAMDELDERFLVISGDVLTDIDLTAIVAAHEEHKALATIGLTPVEDPLEFGIVITRDDGSIERFLEKPSWGQVFSDTINTGIFVLEPEIFDYIAPDQPVDFSSDVFPTLLEDDRPLYGHVARGHWEDVGTLEAYLRAHRDVLDGAIQVDVPGFRLDEGVWLGEGAEVHPEASVQGPVVVGDNCRVDAGARLGPYTIIGTNVKVRADADLERTVVHDNAYIGPRVQARGAVIGRSCDLRTGARVDEGVVLGDECFVGEQAVLSAGVKVYPFKTVEDGAVVNDSIVWESKGARSLFGRLGVSGLANVDITPELAVKVALAYGSTLKRGDRVTTSRDSSRAARMLKRAVMAGLNAAGIDVSDLEVSPLPVTRFQVRTTTSVGGITVRLAEGDPQSVVIRFFDGDGADLPEAAQRKVERMFRREDVRRVLGGEVGDISYPPRAVEHYTAALVDAVDVVAVRDAGFKVVIDYAFGSTSYVMPNVLSHLGIDVLAVNPYASTRGAASFERDQHAAAVADLVRASGSHLGALLHPDGDRLTVIDDHGRVLDDEVALHAVLRLMARREGVERVALPVNCSLVAAQICQEAGVEVVWTKISRPALMEEAVAGDVQFAGDGAGGYVFPGFLPAFDGIAALAYLLELVARSGQSLSETVDSVKPSHVVHETVVTPWEQKGLVMRSLVERSAEHELVLVDGVKVLHTDGWALALPDPEEPLTHVWAEAKSDAAARQLADEYVRRIRQLVR